MLDFVDQILNRVTMYRLVLYYLLALLALGIVASAMGLLPFSPYALLFSAGALTFFSFVANDIFAKVFKAQANSESVYITALILALIISPVMPTDLAGLGFLFWASIWAMASKYIFAIGKKHIFNPAAFAVALTAFTIGQSASWWVGGNLPLLAFVAIGGLLIVRKIQRFDLVIAFFAVAVPMLIFTSPVFNPWATVMSIIEHTPIFFFAFVMLTEPLTTPPTRALRIAYGAFVGAIYAPAISVMGIHATPELALLAGNILSYALSPKSKRVFTLAEKAEVGAGIYDFRLATDKPLSFRPGQYMEWTLAHEKSDGRGNRRYFTLASSPTESDVRLGVHFYEPSSSFKRALKTLTPGATLVGGQLAGDFTIPRDKKKKLVFIAGGIGVTPFRSMVKYLSDRHERRDVILLYSNRTLDEIAYRDVFDEAERKIGLRAAYFVTDGDPAAALPPNTFRGRIDARFLGDAIPDFQERMFYISGPRGMVVAFEKTLHELGVPARNIKVDFFPGFA